MRSSNQGNRLTGETSPYLLQHAQNPIDWYPWGAEAFERAVREDKPVFLSIGYSACHWCHVMGRESFEDEDVARALNRSFICIKVDREERPDVDYIYMQACMAMTGSGGWPLSVFLTPEKKPFFAGTYFPKTGRPGIPGLLAIASYIESNWHHGRKKLERSAERIMAYIKENESVKSAALHPAELSRAASELLLGSYDERWGGFGNAPKFPMPHALMFLMRTAYGERMDHPAWCAVRHTLAAMAAGGIRDHVGGGFSRYTTDPMWLTPHFEKMLTDNALLCMAYTECYEKTGEFAHIAREIADYMLREMRSPEGGFYTSQDADSEGEEGKYYCWSPEEVKEILGENEGTRFCLMYDITERGNFCPEEEFAFKKNARNIPNLIRMPLGGDDLVFAGIALSKLLEARQKRVPPARDEKVLPGVSALAAAALAKAGRALAEPLYTKRAEECTAFLLNNLPSGEVSTLDGYAYPLWALLEVYRSTLNSRWLDEARILGSRMVELFSAGDGFLYFTPNDAHDLPVRGVNAQDGASPSGQSVAAHCMLKLSRLTGDAFWEDWFKGLTGGLSGAMVNNPESYSWMIAALLEAESGGMDITLTPGKGLDALRNALSGFHPFMTVRLDESWQTPARKAAAYLCRYDICFPALDGAAALAAAIEPNARIR